MKFLILIALGISLTAPAAGAQAPVVRDPGVIYLADFDLKPIRLRVLAPAPTSFESTGARYAGTLREGQEVELQAVGDSLFRVRGRAQQGQILAWVSPEYLAPLPEDFLESLRNSDERRRDVEGLIARNEVALGMVPEEVERAIGRPNKRSKKTNAEKTEQVWEYIRYQSVPHQTTYIGRDGFPAIATTWVKTPVGSLTITFSDGTVTAINETEG